MKSLLFALALALPAAALAQASAVTLTAKAYVARPVTDAQGKKTNKLFDPDKTPVTPGEPIVMMLDYKNNGAKPATAFVINNPIPAPLSYTGVEQAWASQSVDGGKSFGPLATLKVKAADGSTRPAQAADVTHVRWTFAQPIAPGAAGRVSFYAVVK